jgi:hypothetical protein
VSDWEEWIVTFVGGAQVKFVVHGWRELREALADLYPEKTVRDTRRVHRGG